MFPGVAQGSENPVRILVLTHLMTTYRNNRVGAPGPALSNSFGLGGHNTVIVFGEV